MPIGHKGITPRLHPSVFVAEGARIIGDVEIGEDSSVWFNAVIRGDILPIRIGRRTNVQDGCILHTKEGFPLAVGNEVTFGHGVTAHGCTIGDLCLLGIGCVVLDGAVVGKGSVIGSGANVFTAVRPPKYVSPFAWGGEGAERVTRDGFLNIAARVLPRRDVAWDDATRASLSRIYDWATS